MNYLVSSFGLGALFLLLYAALQWLGFSLGSLADWLIGIAIFWWLVIVVTVPWNVYFEAKEVLNEAEISRGKNIPVDQKQIDYAEKITQWSIIAAIALHLISALVLYILAATGVTPLGYIAAGAALLLTILRPAIRAYQYLASRLRMIRQQIKYPREDIVELRNRFDRLETIVTNLEKQLDVNEENSFAATQNQNAELARREIARLSAIIEQFQETNKLAHERLSNEAKNAVSQLTEDSQFLGHVREIIRFFKEA